MKREILQEAHGAVWQAGQEGMKGERPELSVMTWLRPLSQLTIALLPPGSLF